MKFISLVSCLILTSTYSSAQRIETGQPNSGKIVHVETALNHLTVIEVSEPVTMVAAGSPSFKVERRDNKVFVQPLEEGQSTNLFIWTASTRYNYELEPAGNVAGMHFAIDHSAPPVPGDQSSVEALRTAVTSLESRAAVIRAFVRSVPVKTERPLSVKDRVAVVIKDVLKMDDRMLIRFSVQNRGPEIYEVQPPRVTVMTQPKSHRSLVPLSLTQLSEKDAERIRRNGEAPLEVVQTEIQSRSLKPGEGAVGIVAIRPIPDTSKPTVLRLHFPRDQKGLVTATLVL